jgi:DNA-binding beta-propeller fold protein YncE
MEQSRGNSIGKRAETRAGSALASVSGAVPGGRFCFSLLSVLLLVLLGGTLTSCSTSTGAGADTEDLNSQKALIWPSPPSPPRISYSKSISTPKDIGAGTGFFKKLADVLFGAAVNNMIKPYGLTADSKGRIIVADTALKRLHIYDVKEKKYSFIESAGDTGFISLIGVAVDSDDNIYITDSLAAMVYVFNPKGDYIRGFDAGTRPTGLAIDKAAARLYVVDTGSHKRASSAFP